MATQLNDWLSIDKISGTGNAEITLTASSYQELVDRTASIKIQAQSTNAILTIKQKAYSPIEKNNEYFWVEFEQTNGVVSGLTNKHTDMHHSFDGEVWETTPNTLSMGSKTLVYFKNDSKKISDDTTQLNIQFNSNAKVGGNLSSITDMTNYCCYQLFYQNKYLIDASELILPWDVLAYRCYRDMFSWSSRLTTAPELPATTLAKDCYMGMFSNCRSLTTAPALPATTLADWCYRDMFDGCTSLITAPALPATTLKSVCYGRMFAGCTNLATAPALPATTLASACYHSMFQGCTSLITAPALPATTLADSCYYMMFQGCSNLATAPILPATTLASKCYEDMFQGCSNLATAPALPATTLADFCYRDMFSGCTSLIIAPELPATTLADFCYSNMFQGCTSLTTAPILPATTLVSKCYYMMFQGCTKLNYIKCLATDVSADSCLSYWTENVAKTGTFIKHPDANLPTGTSGIPQGWIINDAEHPITPNPDTPSNDYFWVKFEETNGKVSIKDAKVSYSFDGNTWTNNVASISMGDNTIVYLQGLNNTTTNKAKIQFTKKAKVGGDLSSLKEIGDSAFKYLFLNNTYLTDASALILPWATLANGCYYSMFKGCTSLVAAPTLPATTLAKDCYYNMFYGCIRLVSAPTLPATTLVDYCYGRMFAGCTNLNYIKMLATDISADTCLASWVDGVASTGTFIKHPDANLSSGVSGIPSGWTVETATS